MAPPPVGRDASAAATAADRDSTGAGGVDAALPVEREGTLLKLLPLPLPLEEPLTAAAVVGLAAPVQGCRRGEPCTEPGRRGLPPLLPAMTAAITAAMWSTPLAFTPGMSTRAGTPGCDTDTAEEAGKTPWRPLFCSSLPPSRPLNMAPEEEESPSCAEEASEGVPSAAAASTR